ncbi:MAG: hypothetical protein ACRDU9_06830 [Acidimicrobiia bacterium]
MVLPDGTRSESNRPVLGRTALLALAALAFAVGGLALGALTTPDPGTTAETTTTTSTTIDQIEPPIDFDNFSVGQIAVGDPLRWERGARFDEMVTVDLVEHEDRLYLFGYNDWYAGSGGLQVWSSDDGLVWDPLGQVIEETRPIGRVASTPQGLVALESGPTGAGFTIWRSRDAVRWAPELVPVELDSEHATVYPHAVTGTKSTLMVTGDVQIDITGLLEERLGAALGAPVDLWRYGWSHHRSAEGMVIDVLGPLGMVAQQVSTEELGLSETEQSWIVDGYGSSTDTDVWVSRGGDSDWEHSSIEDARWIDSLIITKDSRVIALGHGSTLSGTWVSDGGLDWRRLDFVSRPFTVEPWGDGFAGPDGYGANDVLVSEDAENWDSTGLNDHFPSSIGWGVGPFAAGPGGIVVGVEGWSQPDQPIALSTPPRLTRDGVILTMNLDAGVLDLESGGQHHEYHIYGSTPPENIVVDLSTESVEFFDDQSGDLLSSFSFSELMAAAETYWSRDPFPERYQAMAFTTDGVEWTIQDIEEDLGGAVWIRGLEVTADRVIALVSGLETPYVRDETPGFEIWSAPIP